ncbi:MAG: 2-phospho-L-lactate guanylyltransferase [Candidatus Lokiarchaeota archaeon]|nr:2-phospho-L-lactate guanylyltransferase [Candidatus Lokiarchaeota archaeon]
MNYIIIPIKSFKNSKNRLKIKLRDDIRINLCLFMAMDVLNVVSKNKDFEKIVIITREKGAFSKFENEKINILMDNDELGINQAILTVYKNYNINEKDSVLILHSDIPSITPEDLDLIVKKANSSNKIAILVPSEKKDGTNAVYIKPANLMDFQFGKNSYEKHLEQLKKVKNIDLFVLENKNLSLDIDTYEDLIKFIERKTKTLSQNYLSKIKIKN